MMPGYSGLTASLHSKVADSGVRQGAGARAWRTAAASERHLMQQTSPNDGSLGALCRLYSCKPPIKHQGRTKRGDSAGKVNLAPAAAALPAVAGHYARCLSAGRGCGGELRQPQDRGPPRERDQVPRAASLRPPDNSLIFPSPPSLSSPARPDLLKEGLWPVQSL